MSKKRSIVHIDNIHDIYHTEKESRWQPRQLGQL
jgi:hypothetical protein